ncbi:hypothetical protein M427DRAFT_65855 [Gonapodya prolifera JEL478]|uniref:Acyl-CoA dehydrogenase/oxidase C-terminal domain-containing protein n=1 Tax=Gonapodya prolifera (strain JEL478) TaxID=1344416 RepID=A0A139AZ14_GONPJ|nr:hypothetical protein M427DRAFT_65855 [Gonapodya prolifera JEL478]|eukprot:KXS21966.1 hypothetical protein M427DRAFT_65855 [Gonapodya prolifera JEL478]
MPLLLRGMPTHAKILQPFIKREGAPLASLVNSEPTGTANFGGVEGKGIRTTAREEGDWIVIEGEKIWATNCAGWVFKGAGLQCVTRRFIPSSSASASRSSPSTSDTNVVVAVTWADIEASPPGSYTVLKHFDSFGLTAKSGPLVRISGVRVPKSQLLCQPGQGLELCDEAFTMSAIVLGAMSVGVMRAEFDSALAFAKRDDRGGAEPILTKQSRRSTEGAWLPPARELAYHAKVYCSESAVKAVIDCVYAAGVTTYDEGSGLGLGKLVKVTMVLPLFDGGNVGVRKRQLQKLMCAADYDAWGTTM